MDGRKKGRKECDSSLAGRGRWRMGIWRELVERVGSKDGLAREALPNEDLVKMGRRSRLKRDG